MCSPSLSNSLVIDDNYFEKNDMIKEVVEVTGWWNSNSYAYKIDESVTWDWLLKHSDQLKTVKMSGGEPFYNKHVIRFIDKCIEDDTAKNLTLTFRTNGTKFSEDIMQKLIKFKNNFHEISVDGFEKSHEYIRYPSTFEHLDKSLRLYKSYISSPMRLVYIVSIHNIMDIPKFIDWARSIDSESNLMFSQIYSNERGIALKHLSIKLLNKAKEQLVPYATMPRPHNVKDVIAQIDDAIKFNKEDRSLALRETVIFDKSRNQSFEDYLNTDIVNWLKNVQE
jgi:MoaA/NifB/PqqE/SkfB family radical SAM enzyme